jgi:signal peptidase I
LLGGILLQEKTKKEVFSWIKSITFALLIAFICHNFLFSPTTVYGESMEPTFQPKDRVLISKMSNINRFDIVVFNAPDADQQYIKRIIGLPGDRVEMKDDVLYINGKPYEESYVKRNNDIALKDTGDFTLKELTGKTTVPNGYFFVLGDNRLISKDSRRFGFISADSIMGTVKLRFYPLQDVGIPK